MQGSQFEQTDLEGRADVVMRLSAPMSRVSENAI
jgi:hypothetical protein